MRLSVNSHHYSTQNTKTASSKMYQSLQKPKIENISLTLLHTQVHTSTEIQKQFDKEQWDSLAFKNGIFAWYWERILVPLAAGLCYWRKSSSSPEYCIFFKKKLSQFGELCLCANCSPPPQCQGTSATNVCASVLVLRRLLIKT